MAPAPAPPPAKARPGARVDPRRPSVSRWLLGAAILVASAIPSAWYYLLRWPQDQWQVDVEVYREAGRSVLMGRPIYDHLTEPPQLLPFTYPPFSALLSVPLGLIPFGAVGWVAFVAQILATTCIVWYAAFRLTHRTGRWLPVTLALLVAPLWWIQPVAEGLRFGQVNAFIVLACLMDLRIPRPRVLRRVPPGVLVGLATAVKLTPGVFLIHYAVNRRWPELTTAVGTAALATIGAALLLPEASVAFWGGALQDPGRLGPNAGPSNQSIRGVLMRIWPGEPTDPGGDGGLTQTLVWAVLCVIVAVVGFWLASRAWRRGDSITEVAAVGLMACMLSPVAWVHHFHWLAVAFFAILGSDPLKDRRRILAVVAIGVVFAIHVPYWGHEWMVRRLPVQPVGVMLENAYFLAAIATIALMWWSFRRDERDDEDPPGRVLADDHDFDPAAQAVPARTSTDQPATAEATR